MSDVLGPTGALAGTLPHYEDRPEQRQMAGLVDQVLTAGGTALIEAGTGTGKTLAYLVPALTTGRRIVVSTGTKALQDQILRHDVPLLETIMNRPFRAVALKGVGNYLCRRKLADALARGIDASLANDLEEVALFANETVTGDRADLATVAENSPVWAAVTTSPDARLGGRCPYFERCFVTQARRAAEKADLVIVNHHLYFADLALKAMAPTAKILPDHEGVIFDEAHQLEDVITEHFGVRISSMRIAQLLRDAEHAFDADRKGKLFSRLSSAGRIIGAIERTADAFFQEVANSLGQLPAADPSGRSTIPDELFSNDTINDRWLALDTTLDELACHAALAAESLPKSDDGEEDEGAEAIALVGYRAQAFRDDLATIAERRADKYTYWAERRTGRTALCASPVEVGGIVRTRVLASMPSVVLTSATLTASGQFDYVRGRLGLDDEDSDELRLSSPFDYATQAILYLPRDLPLPSDPGFAPAAAKRIAELLALTDGSAFVLFTSHRALTDAARRLPHLGDWPLFVQGTLPRTLLLDRFRNTPRGVLLGTSSFWEGVDVPGDALSQVIIDKLPFGVHTDPLVAARMRLLEERGLDPFDSYQLPNAAISLTQGFGRLIRRRDDRGIVSVLDQRIVTRRYGKVFIDTLPAALGRTSSIEQVRRWWLRV